MIYSIVWIAFTEFFFLFFGLFPDQAELWEQIVEKLDQALLHRHVRDVLEFMPCTAANKLDELGELELLVLTLFCHVLDQSHLAHAEAIYDLVLVGYELRVARHQINAVILVHEFMARFEVGLI